MKVKLLIILVLAFNAVFSCIDSSFNYSDADNSLVVSAPSFSPKGALFTDTQNVKISSKTAGAFIRYTRDGSQPDCSTNGEEYSGEIEVSNTTVLKAIACKSWMSSSTVVSETYNFGFKVSGNVVKTYSDEDDQVMSFSYMEFYDINSKDKIFTFTDYFGDFSVYLPEGVYYLAVYWYTTYNPEAMTEGTDKGPYDEEGFMLSVDENGQTQNNAIGVRLTMDNPKFLKSGESLEILSPPLKTYTNYFYTGSQLSAEELYWDALDDSSGSPAQTTTYSYNSEGLLNSVLVVNGSSSTYKSYTYDDKFRLTSLCEYTGEDALDENLISKEVYSYDDDSNVISVSYEDVKDAPSSYYRVYEYNSSSKVKRIKVYEGSSIEDAGSWVRTVEYEFKNDLQISSMTIYEPFNKSTYYTYNYDGEDFIEKKYNDTDFASPQFLEWVRTDDSTNGQVNSTELECYDTGNSCVDYRIENTYYSSGLPEKKEYYIKDANGNDELYLTMTFAFNDYLLSSLVNDFVTETTDDVDFFLKVDTDTDYNISSISSYAHKTDATGSPDIQRKNYWDKNESGIEGN